MTIYFLILEWIGQVASTGKICAQCSKQFPLIYKGKVKEKENRVDAIDEFVNGCPK